MNEDSLLPVPAEMLALLPLKVLVRPEVADWYLLSGKSTRPYSLSIMVSSLAVVEAIVARVLTEEERDTWSLVSMAASKVTWSWAQVCKKFTV